MTRRGKKDLLIILMAAKLFRFANHLSVLLLYMFISSLFSVHFDLTYFI